MKLRLLVYSASIGFCACVTLLLSRWNNVPITVKKTPSTVRTVSESEPALLLAETEVPEPSSERVKTANFVESSSPSDVRTADYVTADWHPGEALPPYPLPDVVTDALETFAAETDILILGEVHGTQEVPALAASLFAPLSKLGYRALALEVPNTELEPINAWATGQTETVPEFFARPSGDGRGNIQLLSLIRLALSPQYGWKLICFDQSISEDQEQSESPNSQENESFDKPRNSPAETADDDVKIFRKRDAAMAANVERQLRQMTPRPKVLAICGNVHNRIENQTTQTWLKRLWPSFAAVLQHDNPDWKIGSVNIRFHRGGFYNGGKINEFQGRKIDQAEAHTATETGYHWELYLPYGTPATFLSPPVDAR